MKTILKPALAAGVLVALGTGPAIAAPAPSPAPAPASAGPVVPGIGWINIDGIKVNSNAWKVAEQQRPVTYKATIDQANARAQAIQAQLAPLAQKFDRDRAAPAAKTPAGQAALQAQYTQLQQLQAAGEEEITRILAPIQLSRAYVEEQVNDQLQKAINQAVVKRRITMLVRAETMAYADPAYNMNQAVLEEVNALIPSAQLVPPAGWEPRELREQRAQQAAAAAAAGGRPAAAPAPTPTAPKPQAGPQPEGR